MASLLIKGSHRPRIEEPGGQQSMGSLRVGCDWATNTPDPGDADCIRQHLYLAGPKTSPWFSIIPLSAFQVSDNFLFLWPLESTWRLANLGLSAQASVWTLLACDRGVCGWSPRHLATSGDFQMAIQADGCVVWSLVTCGSDNEVFWSPDHIWFCHYGFLLLVTSPHLNCFTAYFLRRAF